MRVRRQPTSRQHPVVPAQPLPHPSWSPPLGEQRRVSAQEFWQRLGL